MSRKSHEQHMTSEMSLKGASQRRWGSQHLVWVFVPNSSPQRGGAHRPPLVNTFRSRLSGRVNFTWCDFFAQVSARVWVWWLAPVSYRLEKQRWDEHLKSPEISCVVNPAYILSYKSSASRTWWFIFQVKSGNFWWKVWVWVKFSVCVSVCMYTCVYVFWCTVHSPCGLAAAAAWPESRPPMQCLWECGEFGWDQLIKHCTLALSCFPYRQGKRWPMGKPHRQPVSGASLYCCFFFPFPHMLQFSWPGVRNFNIWPPRACFWE